MVQKWSPEEPKWVIGAKSNTKACKNKCPDGVRPASEEAEAMRRSWQEQYGHLEALLAHYKVEHVGTKWTKTHLGTAVDKCRGVPSTEVGRVMLKKRSLNGEFGCTFSTYTREVCETLCYSWCHKMSFFLGLWEASGFLGDFELTQEHVDSYNEPQELTLLSTDFLPNSAAERRLRDLRVFHPFG